jgi:two-component system CheB/CheR fusion protein
MEPHGMQDRIRIAGPSLTVTPEAGVAMAMVLNELATNAVKYGALSNAVGQLEVTWLLDRRPDGQWIQLRWLESGGPPVTPPSRRGFGSNLIARSIEYQLGGTVTNDFLTDGLQCEIVFPSRGLAPSRVPKEI